jgi:hypothetical protein
MLSLEAGNNSCRCGPPVITKRAYCKKFVTVIIFAVSNGTDIVAPVSSPPLKMNIKKLSFFMKNFVKHYMQ